MKESTGREVICPHRNRNMEMSIEFSKLLFLELSLYSFFHRSSIMLIKIHVKTIHNFHPWYFCCKFSLECYILKLASHLVSRLNNTWLLSMCIPVALAIFSCTHCGLCSSHSIQHLEPCLGFRRRSHQNHMWAFMSFPVIGFLLPLQLFS